MKMMLMMNGEITNLDKCNVMIGDIKCTNDSVVTYKCMIDVKNKGLQEHDVHVCQQHRRHFDEENL